MEVPDRNEPGRADGPISSIMLELTKSLERLSDAVSKGEKLLNPIQANLPEDSNAKLEEIRSHVGSSPHYIKLMELNDKIERNVHRLHRLFNNVEI